MIALSDYHEVETRTPNTLPCSTIGPMEVSYQLAAAEDIVIVDVRALEDYRKGHLPGALNLPQEEWNGLHPLRRGVANILYGYNQTCDLAAQACVRFMHEGFHVVEMDGGYTAWKKSGQPVEK